MELESVRAFFGWCALVNWGLLVVWWLGVTVAHDNIQRLHGKWFSLTPERFDEIHYRSMAQFKVGIMLLNLAPYLALRIIG